MPPSSFDPLTEDEIAALEISNGLRQFDLGIEIIQHFLDRDRPFNLRPSLLLELQACAVDGLTPSPGCWRSTPVTISESAHQPPEAFLVPLRIQEMCDYINDNWHERSGLHLSAYIMWRLNWIHPFSDGNGRTSRMISYIILSIKSGYVFPGSPTIPQQIQNDRTQYFHALEAADRSCRDTGSVDVSVMEDLLRNMLAVQLLSVIEKANGGPVDC